MIRMATKTRRWRPAATPLGRLAQAFDWMEGRGLIARGRWLCCQNCGCHAMQEKFDKAKEGCKPLGWVFFHDQDWDAYLETGELYLSFGSFTGIGSHIGWIIADSLFLCDIPFEWEGDERTRILVKLGTPVQRRWRGHA